MRALPLPPRPRVCRQAEEALRHPEEQEKEAPAYAYQMNWEMRARWGLPEIFTRMTVANVRAGRGCGAPRSPACLRVAVRQRITCYSLSHAPPPQLAEMVYEEGWDERICQKQKMVTTASGRRKQWVNLSRVRVLLAGGACGAHVAWLAGWVAKSWLAHLACPRPRRCRRATLPPGSPTSSWTAGAQRCGRSGAERWPASSRPCSAGWLVPRAPPPTQTTTTTAPAIAASPRRS